MARKKPHRPRAAVPSNETRLSEVTTVGWMLSVLTTLACQVTALAIWAFFQGRADADRALIFASYLHFSAIVMGLASLGLMTVVLKVRSEAPPRSILIFAVLVAVAPIAALVF